MQDKFNLFDRVEQILCAQGYSHIFTTADFELFKSQVDENDINAHWAIVELFLQGTSEPCDLDEYIF